MRSPDDLADTSSSAPPADSTASRPAVDVKRVSAAGADESRRPELLVLIATEEEFDWRGEFDPAATSTRAIAAIERAQGIFDAYGVRPTYALDYPVAEHCGEVFRALADSGRASIGAHLHPWVNPPHTDATARENSFPGNLPPDVEHAKLRELVASIERNTGHRPRVYQAGRYGFGPNTAEHLIELGFRVDASAAPPFDYSNEGGPNYARHGAETRWIDAERRLLEVPVTGAFAGALERVVPAVSPGLFSTFSRGPFSALRAAGVAARTGLLERLRLSPEGHDARALRRLTRALHARGTRTFTFYFHSTSLEPGCTEYVQSEADLDEFLSRFRRYFDFFFGEFGGVASTHEEVYSRWAARLND